MARESDDPRTHTICFRVTKGEKDEVDTLIGSRNRSEVLRRLVLTNLREARDSK